MLYLRFPPELQEKVFAHLANLFMRHTTLLEESAGFLDELPPSLRLRCSNFLYTATVQSSWLFTGCTAGFLRELTLVLRTRLSLPGERIINEGQRWLFY